MTARHSRRLVIVGGGLAGVAAAVEAHRAGLEVCLIEQRAAVRGPRRLVSEFASAGDAEVWLDSAVWGIWGRDLAVHGPRGQSSVLAFDHLIVATGSFERPVAFPGWTLSGAMTLSGATRLLDQGVTPGARVVLAGYGGFVASAASELARRGLTPIAVVDASARAGRLVVRGEGNGRLQRVVTARLDAQWHPRPETEQTNEADALVLAFGSQPEDHLARMAGCVFTGSAFVDPRTVCDPWLRTSVPGVLVAGDAGGIVGPEACLDQGRLAGVTAAVDAGCLRRAEAEHRAGPMQRRLLVRRESMPEPPRAGVFALADRDTVICRCEDVTAGQLTDHLFEGSLEPSSPIAETRAGMGLCQGRNCANLIAATIARHSGVSIDRIPPITPRPPIVPLPIGVLAERPPVFPPLSGLRAAR